MKHIIRILKNNRYVRDAYKNVVQAAIDTNISEITPFKARRCDYDEIRLNLLVPSISREHIFGGISTALKFFDELATKGNFKRRIILTDACPMEKDLSYFPGYSLLSSDDDSKADFEIVPFNDRYNRDIPVGKNDIFMATAWWTAYHGQRLINWQAKEYDNLIKNMIYFIQDFEPGFYPWSSKYALADGTYRSESPQIAVFNTSLLRDYFLANGYHFYKEYAFEPKLNNRLREILIETKKIDKKKQILIYGRPSVDRNAFTLIIEALKIWVWKQQNINEWNIVSAGEKHPEVDLGNGMKVTSKGKMTIDEYGDILKESAIGISLMISPHPSYPPLEMANFGLGVITNTFANKDLSDWHENIICLKNVTPESIAVHLYEICVDFSLDRNKYISGKNLMSSYLSNGEPFEFLDDLCECLR